jgi:hypothetical protein
MVSSPKVPMAASEGHALVASFRGTSRRLATTNVSPGRGTLQAAVTAATAGDTLVLADGTYTASVAGANANANAKVAVAEVWEKGITIRAANPLKAIIDGEGANIAFYMAGYMGGSHEVILDGLSITKAFRSGGDELVCVLPMIELHLSCPPISLHRPISLSLDELSALYLGWRLRNPHERHGHSLYRQEL